VIAPEFQGDTSIVLTINIVGALGLGVAAATDRPALQMKSHQKRPRRKSALPV
jgi:hypothetical protein